MTRCDRVPAGALLPESATHSSSRSHLDEGTRVWLKSPAVSDRGRRLESVGPACEPAERCERREDDEKRRQDVGNEGRRSMGLAGGRRVMLSSRERFDRGSAGGKAAELAKMLSQWNDMTNQVGTSIRERNHKRAIYLAAIYRGRTE